MKTIDLDRLRDDLVLSALVQFPEEADRNRRVVAVVDALSDLAQKYGATVLALVILHDVETLHEKLNALDAPIRERIQ